MTEKKVEIREENIFHKARHEIDQISKNEKADIGVACLVWATETKQENYSEDLNEFLQFQTALFRTEGGKGVKAYFEG